jgi:hypothetical protein
MGQRSGNSCQLGRLPGATARQALIPTKLMAAKAASATFAAES